MARDMMCSQKAVASSLEVYVGNYKGDRDTAFFLSWRA